MSREQLIGLVIAQAGQIAALTESNEQLRAANAQLGVRLARLEHLLSRNSGNSSMPPSPRRRSRQVGAGTQAATRARPDSLAGQAARRAGIASGLGR